MVSTMASPRPTPASSVRSRSTPRRNGSVSVGTSSAGSGAPVFSTASSTAPGRTLVVTRTVPASGRLWTIALCTRFVVSWSSRAGDPVVKAMSPCASTVTPRPSARGSRVSAASSAISDRSTCSRANVPRSARLSSSSASVRSIARLLTACRRSMTSPVARPGSARATSRSVLDTASGVRSSWEALAANLLCSATCASSRASIVSNASASSRNSSPRPGSLIRWESEPRAAVRVASVIRVSGASIRPARNHPPTRPNTRRIPRTVAAAGAKVYARS